MIDCEHIVLMDAIQNKEQLRELTIGTLTKAKHYWCHECEDVVSVMPEETKQ